MHKSEWNHIAILGARVHKPYAQPQVQQVLDALKLPDPLSTLQPDRAFRGEFSQKDTYMLSSLAYQYQHDKINRWPYTLCVILDIVTGLNWEFTILHNPVNPLDCAGACYVAEEWSDMALKEIATDYFTEM